MVFNEAGNIAKGIQIVVGELENRTDSNAESKKKGEKDDNRAKKAGPNKIVICLAETVGTALLLFIGCMGCINVGGPNIHQFPAFTFGLAVLLIIQIFGHISGSHLNPAVTIGAAYLGVVDIMTTPFYFAGQFIGGVVGFGMLKMLVPSQFTTTKVFDAVTNETVYTSGLCTTLPHPDMAAWQAVALEAVITAVLVLVCGGVWDKRNSMKEDSVPIRFGLVIAALAMAAGPFSGASMNTARSFGPALINNHWENHWVYWIGPTIGAFAGAASYKLVFSAPDDEPSEGEEMTDLQVRNNVSNKA